MRPRGSPPMPSAMSRARAPVGIDSILKFMFSPMRMIEPLPNCFSIWLSAASRAFERSSVAIAVSLFFTAGTLGTRCHIGRSPLGSQYYEHLFVWGICGPISRKIVHVFLPVRQRITPMAQLVDQRLVDELLEISTDRICATW